MLSFFWDQVKFYFLINILNSALSWIRHFPTYYVCVCFKEIAHFTQLQMLKVVAFVADNQRKVRKQGPTVAGRTFLA